jgi:transposase-like protein
MTKINYSCYRFAPEIIQLAIWLYVRFTLSFRDVEDLLAQRGIFVSYETVPNPATAQFKNRPLIVKAGQHRYAKSSVSGIRINRGWPRFIPQQREDMRRHRHVAE